MKVLIGFSVLICVLSGCTVTGALLGIAVDEITGEDKYAVKYAMQGLEEDIYLVADKDVELSNYEPKKRKSKKSYVKKVKSKN